MNKIFGIPATGDHSDIVLWVCVLSACVLAALIALFIYLKKEKDDRQ